MEIVPDIAQSTHGIRNIFADIRNVPTRPHMVLGMFLLAFPVHVRWNTDHRMVELDLGRCVAGTEAVDATAELRRNATKSAQDEERAAS